MDKERLYLTDREVAADPEFLGVFSVSTLQKHRVKGTGPRYLKLGKCFYTREWIREWLAGRVIRSTSEAA